MPLIFALALSFAIYADELKPVQKPKKVTVDADTDPVEAARISGAYGTGLIYARPARGTPNSGVIFKTEELHFVVGNFADDTKYSGNGLNASTKSRRLLDEIDQLDRDKHYIFAYWYALPLHFNMEDTSRMVTAYQPAPEPADFLKTALPTEYEVQNGRTGGQAGPAIASGRLVEVLRWNTYFLGRPQCTFTLDMGGSRRTSKEVVANEMDFNLYSETACRYVESILPYGLELDVTFTQSYINVDGFDHTAHAIKVMKVPGVTRHESGYARELMNDPEFRAQLEKLIDEHWAKAHPNP